jgi:hypothetical protein
MIGRMAPRRVTRCTATPHRRLSNRALDVPHPESAFGQGARSGGGKKTSSIEHYTQFDGELFKREWLCQEMYAWIEDTPVYHCIMGVTSRI